MTLEEYYGKELILLKQGESYLKSLIETYRDNFVQEELQAILYIKSRIKTPESMMEKLRKRGHSEDSNTALIKTHDAIGVRVVCSFVEDVYCVAKWLQRRKDIQIIEEKDYIACPKPNGYRSLHLIIRFTADNLKGIIAEVQIRTIAIDFWAALEHQINYKHHVPHEELIRNELKRCADEIASVDLSMQTIKDILQSDLWNTKS